MSNTIIGNIAYGASPSQEDFRVFETQSALDAYLDSARAKAGQTIKLKDANTGKYKAYIIQGTVGNFSTAAMGGNYVKAASLEAIEGTPDQDTDYYIGDNESGYLHYRYVVDEVSGDGDFFPVGGDTADIEAAVATNTSNIATNAAGIVSANTAINTLNNKVTNVKDYRYTAEYGKFILREGDTEETDNVFRLVQIDKDGQDEVVAAFPIQGGNSSSSLPTTNLNVTKITNSPIVTTPDGSVVISVNFAATDSDNSPIDASYTWKVERTVVTSGMFTSQGVHTFDLTQYCSTGTQRLTLTVTDVGGNTVIKTWTVQIVDVRLTSNFNDTIKYTADETVRFECTPYGGVAKQIHLKLDGVAITPAEGAESLFIPATQSGITQYYTLPAKSHGAHLVECYVTAVIGSGASATTVETPHIFKDVIYFDSTDTSKPPVIGCKYRFDYYGAVDLMQYGTLQIPYTVYSNTTATPTVVLTADGAEVDSIRTQAANNTWSYKSGTVALHTLTISCGGTSVPVKVDVDELNIDVAPVTSGLAFDFNPVGYSNNSANRLWTDTTNTDIHMTVSNGFDWANGGYKTDDQGDTYFLVRAGDRAYINYNMFPNSDEHNPSTDGAELKVIFRTENVRDNKAVWMTNVETLTSGNSTINRGIQLSVHEGWLKTNTASDTDVTIGTGDDAISLASTNTYLYIPYSEDDKIELDINIDVLGENDHSFVMAYEDGCPSKAFVYDSSDNFYQSTPQQITIGSDDCDVRIYRMKAYSGALTSEGIMRNFIADASNPDEMLARYERNSIYYNAEAGESGAYTPYASQGVLTPEHVAERCPNLKVLKLDCPIFTSSKKDFVKHSSLQCIHKGGDPMLDNWIFRNIYHAGQGTTSDKYGVSARNVDFLCNADGVHNCTNTKKTNYVFDPEYVTTLTLGYGAVDSEQYVTHETVDANDISDEARVALTRTSIPTNFFNFKANVASSENANNALLQKRYNDFLPYTSLARIRNGYIKNDMEFVPAILFIKENSTSQTHTEFNDTGWHFYALGNLGDSKKTDYSRAYDPEDMNEFTIEISDNVMHNSTFQSGVYMDGSTRVVQPVSDTTAHQYVYPITAAEWNANNYRYYTLYNEEFDGDHSFEPRYACCGDYRDGKMVNDSHAEGLNDAQLALNEGVWRAFYRWVITSTDVEFRRDLDQWCVRDAVQFWYVFTHHFTMMDNRAKNTFWHFAKTGTYRAVTTPVPELLHVYCEKDGDVYTPTQDIAINNSKTYYTQYAFDMWDYDNDTAIGINNNGELTFPYGREDTDYEVDGDPSSGYVFNGAESAFWCRLRDLCSDQLDNVYGRVNKDCWNAQHIITEFDNYQNTYPEEIWRLDVMRKYVRPFNGTEYDGSIPKTSESYLRDMMQGRKKYQRRQWLRDQYYYFGTKHLSTEMRDEENFVLLRCKTPQGSVAVPANYDIQIVPYSDMYLRVDYGTTDSNDDQFVLIRAKANQFHEVANPVSRFLSTYYELINGEYVLTSDILVNNEKTYYSKAYTIPSPVDNATDLQIAIYGAPRIKELSDLSRCYIRANNFAGATKLRKLVIGNATPGYSNTFLTELNIGNNYLLEELDLRNCPNLTKGLNNLKNFVNLKTLYAEGTGFTAVEFANYGKVELAHLPATVNTLTMRNLNNLTSANFSLDMTGMLSLTLEGGNLDIKSIVNGILSTQNNVLERLNLYNIDWTGAASESNTTLLNKIYNVAQSRLTGEVYISGQVYSSELENYGIKWADLDVNCDQNQIVPTHLVTYVNADDESTVLYQTYVVQGQYAPDPYATGVLAEMPTIPDDEQYTYSFGTFVNGEYQTGSGWDTLSGVVSSARTVTAVYTSTPQVYTVTWYSRPGVSLGSVSANYGSEVVYQGDAPTNTASESSLIYNVFAGWDKSTGFIRGNTDVYAIWKTADLGATQSESPDLNEMTTAQIYAVTKSGQATSFFTNKDYIDITLGQDFSFDNVVSRVLATNYKLDGNNTIDTGIKLFDVDSDSFTLAVDFQFNGTTKDNTLVACYKETGAEGFRLCYNGNPTIQWGDVTQAFGHQKLRDIVVIRHIKGDNRLYIYASNATGSGTVFSDSIFVTQLMRSRATSTDATLTLGGVKFGDGSYGDIGNGYIHWSKVWLDDLGDANCRALASWYHETVRMEYCGTSRYKLAGDTALRSNASFICNHLLVGRKHQMETTNINTNGWGYTDLADHSNDKSSYMRTFCNTRLYDALPIEWKMMVKKVKVYASAGNKSTSVVYSEDYIYIPATVEMNNSTDATLSQEGNYITWYTSDNARVKFMGIPTRDGASYFAVNSDPSTNSENNVQPGDVWRNGNTLYVYVPQSYLDAYEITPSVAASIGGGWMVSEWYWLRSPVTGSTTIFWSVYAVGSVYTNSASNSSGVCPCFSI